MRNLIRDLLWSARYHELWIVLEFRKTKRATSGYHRLWFDGPLNVVWLGPLGFGWMGITFGGEDPYLGQRD